MENSQCQVKVQAELSYPLEVRNWLRQVDSLACLLFNLALEKVIIDSGFQTGATLFYVSILLLTFADHITGRLKEDIREFFISLKVNEEKTKNVIVKGNKLANND
jgi:hypothetical protein